MAHSIVNERSILKETFLTVLSDFEKLKDISCSAKDIVYSDMTRKLCNIRIQEFLSSQKQKYASEKGYASTSGQNLRDKLLSLHTNLQTRIT